MTKEELIQRFIQFGHKLLEQQELEQSLCPTCTQPAASKSPTDYDWIQPHGKLNGKHNHYQCHRNHFWCPINKFNLKT